MKRLIVASTNAGKIREVSLMLSDLAAWNVESLPDLPSIEETGATFMENAVLKAVHYSRRLDALTLADDSGLCVHALDGRPGVHTARYAPSASERNEKVLQELSAAGAADRSASFFCALAVARAGSVVWSGEGELSGQIAAQPTGDSGFGFDPIFFVTDLGRTLAEVSTAEKNRVSARARALQQLRDFLVSL